LSAVATAERRSSSEAFGLLESRPRRPGSRCWRPSLLVARRRSSRVMLLMWSLSAPPQSATRLRTQALEGPARDRADVPVAVRMAGNPCLLLALQPGPRGNAGLLSRSSQSSAPRRRGGCGARGSSRSPSRPESHRRSAVRPSSTSCRPSGRWSTVRAARRASRSSRTNRPPPAAAAATLRPSRTPRRRVPCPPPSASGDHRREQRGLEPGNLMVSRCTQRARSRAPRGNSEAFGA